MYLRRITSLKGRQILDAADDKEFGPTFSDELSKDRTIPMGLLKLWGIKDIVRRLEIRSEDRSRLETLGGPISWCR
jgi:hypothetical protein